MPDGNESADGSDDKYLIQPELFDVHKALLADGWELWVAHRDAATTAGLNYKTERVRFSRVSIVTFSQMAAVTAVDVGLTEEQFLDTCKANFAEAVKRAPRWS